MGGQAIKTFYYDGKLVDIDDGAVPVKVIRNGKSNWKRRYIQDEEEIREVVFSKGIKLDNTEIAKIKQFCNAEEFEPYRNREMTMWEEGWVGYRDEISMEFYGITDDYIPLLHLPMDCLYDEKHIWPSEKLYRYLYNHYYKKLNEKDKSEDNGVKDKKRKKRKSSQGMIEYGGLSLF